MKEDIAVNPKVLIEFSAFQKILGYAQVCPYEISGFGTVQNSENLYIVEEVFLLPQKTARDGSFVEIDSLVLNRFVHQMVQAGKDPSKITFQWHSHAFERVFFSPVDVATIGQYMNDYMISFIINKKGEYRCRFDYFKPLKRSFEPPVEISACKMFSEVLKECWREIEENVKVIERKKKRRKKKHAYQER